MNRGFSLRFFSLLCVALLCVTGPARAQTPSPLPEWQFSAGELLRTAMDPDPQVWSRMVGFSSEYLPRYDGARKDRWLSGPVFDFRYKDIAYLSSGEGLGINLLHSKSYRAGAAIAYDLGRPEKRDPLLHGLGDINPSAQVKLYGEYLLFPVMFRIDARRPIGGYEGWIGDLSLYLPVFGNNHVLLLAGPSVTFADSHYVQQWFGINAGQSRASGLPAYQPSGGLFSASFGLDLTWLISSRWLFNVAAGGERLLGDAAHSPITQRNLPYSFNMTLGYQW